MNEETLSIIVNQKRDIEKLEDYVNSGFKIICDWGKKDHRSIVFLSLCFGVMTVVVHGHNVRIKKLEKQIKELTNKEIDNKVNNDPLETSSAE